MTEMMKTRVTAAEFFQMEESNLPIELIDGEIIVSPTPKKPHQDTTGNAYYLLKTIERQTPDMGEAQISPLDVHLDDENVVQPDVFWVSPDSLCKLGEDGYWHGAPDLVIEILSPSTAKRDKDDKFKLYEKYGTREYWLVDLEYKLVEVWARLEERFARTGVYGVDDTFTSVVLGGQAVAVKEIFS